MITIVFSALPIVKKQLFICFSPTLRSSLLEPLGNPPKISSHLSRNDGGSKESLQQQLLHGSIHNWSLANLETNE
jgi:hypothetical protein